MPMQSKYDLISIGDTTIDVFLEVDPQEANSVCRIDEEKCVVEFDFGAKVPVAKMTRLAAVGNAANNAIGSARLGLKTAIFTTTGSDQDSQETKKVLEEEDVSTEFLVMETGKRSNFSTVINYSAERTIFAYHEERDYKFPKLPPVNWVYYTSIGKGYEVLHQMLLEYLQQTSAKLAFNPGSHHLKSGLELLKPILSSCEVVLVNREEAQSLVGGDIQDIKGLISRLKETGPKIVVVTDGRGGSYASFDGREVWFAGIPEQSPVIERTGCGDSYATAFIGALANNLDIPQAMIWGTMNATSVIQHVGARQGLLTRAGIDKYIGMYGKFVKPKMI